MTRILVTAVNVLTSSLKSSDLTKKDFFKLNLVHIDENMGQSALCRF